MPIQNLEQFEAFLKTRITTREALFMGDIGLRRSKYFMKLLGDPQNKIKIIHIAGTSGKGSTAYLTSHLLQSQGFKVGLSISPHIFDVRERMQINNKLPDKDLILKYFNQILPAIERTGSCKYGMPTYFEILVGLAYYIFAKEKMDYAVIETGLGGRLDGTNTVAKKNKICILTKIGLDHTEILGKNIFQITGEKAGIIGKKNTTISPKQKSTAQELIEKKCKEKEARLLVVKPRMNHSIISSTSQATIFDFKFGKQAFRNIELKLLGNYQVENCALALTCISFLSERDRFKINESKIISSLKKISIPARMEIRKKGKKFLIIDGAHNPQKMTAFISSLKDIFPQQKFDFIVAFKKGKDFRKILKEIMPIADHIFLTSFSISNQDNRLSSVENIKIKKYFQKEKFRNFKIIENNKKEITSVIKKSENSVVLTGSLYLLGSIYHFLNSKH